MAAMAIRWWTTVHPLILESSGFHLSWAMLVALIFSVVTFTLLYFTLLSLRVRLQETEEQIQRLRRY